MGNKDNPRRGLRTKLATAGVTVLLLAGGATYAIQQNLTLQERDGLIHEYQQKLVEQGSLIDQQKKDMSTQQKQVKQLNKKVTDLNTKLKSQEDKTKEVEEQKDKVKSENEQLKKDLSFKKANEAKALAKKQEEAKAELVAKAEPEKVSPRPEREVAAVTETKEEPKEQPKQEPQTAGKTVTVEATAYTAMCAEGCTGITATGVNLKDNPNKKVIAVDPSVIPLGSKVYVPGYGTAIAADTGGGIDGHEIDIHVPNESQATSWGRRNIEVQVIN